MAWNDHIATFIGLLLNAGAVAFAGYEVRQGRAALEASTVLQLQAEGRELFVAAMQNPSFTTCVLSDEKARLACTEKQKGEGANWVGVIFQYYSAAHNQKALGSLTDETWVDIKRDLCSYLKNPVVEQVWRERLSHNFNDKFQSMVAECGKTT